MADPFSPIPNSDHPPHRPDIPQPKTGLPKTSAPAYTEASQQENAVRSTWQKFLGPEATPEDAQKFMNNCINQIITQIKQDQERAKEASDKLKKVAQGQDPDE